MKTDNKVRVIKQLKFSENQKHFIDFILIISLMGGMFAIIGSILQFCGVFPLSGNLYYEITVFILEVASVVYLLILKVLRIKHGKKDLVL